MEVVHGGRAMAGRKLRVDTPEIQPVEDSTASVVADPLLDAESDLAEQDGVEVVLSAEVVVSVVPEPHSLERSIQRELLNHPDIHFSSLVVRRFRDGICLQGVIEVECDLPDVEGLTRELSGVNRVMNHLVVRRQSSNV